MEDLNDRPTKKQKLFQVNPERKSETERALLILNILISIIYCKINIH